jgi:hypothetical protein
MYTDTMAFRIKVNGIDMEADTAAEAMELYRAFSGTTNGHQPQPPSVARQSINQRVSDSGDTALGDYARAAVKFLLSRPNGERTEALADAVGMTGPHKTKGLASVTRQIREWGANTFGLDYSRDCVLKERRDFNGEPVSYHMLSGKLVEKLRGREKELLG